MLRDVCPNGSGARDEGAPLAEDRIRDAYERVLKACRFRGLAACDGADIAQDLFLWFVRHPERSSLLSPACLGRVVAIYVMRHRRRSFIRTARERSSVERAPSHGAWTVPACDETTVSIERLTRLLPAIECAVLEQLRLGATWAEAAARAGVPPGSRDWLRKRMAEHVREAFRAQPIPPERKFKRTNKGKLIGLAPLRTPSAVVDADPPEISGNRPTKIMCRERSDSRR